MKKEFYEILGVEEIATPEQIKKAYRKLAQQWHPDKWSGKNLREQEQANERMQKINRAYEILSDEDKRRRYDLGENDFSDNSQKAAWEAKEEEIRKKEELLKEMREMSGLMREEKEIMEEIWLLNADYIDRFATFNEIGAAKGLSVPTVYTEDLESEGYSRLWEPYKSWSDKVWNMPITIIRGEKEESDELKQFKTEMLQAIKKIAIVIETKKKNKEKERNNSKISQERLRVIETIEREISEKSLKVGDLEKKYHNYKQDINGLDKIHKIRALRDAILLNVSDLAKKRDKEEDNQFPETPNKPKEREEKIKIEEVLNGFRSGKYDNWIHQELVEEIEKEKLNSNSLRELVSLLQTKVKELEQEIAELKAETPQTEEIRQEIKKREVQLQHARTFLNSHNNNNNNNPFPTIPVVIVIVGIVALLGGLVIYKVRKNKIKK